jgi:hypothetical protein
LLGATNCPLLSFRRPGETRVAGRVDELPERDRPVVTPVPLPAPLCDRPVVTRLPVDDDERPAPGAITFPEPPYVPRVVPTILEFPNVRDLPEYPGR